jgi:2-polyprenyl-6-methoxyphenol hydroxylase-like FAD-dependent oxidoreductase
MCVVLAATAAALALVPAPASTIVVGGGPAGLATAIALAKRGWSSITVLDRLEPPASPDDESVWSDTARHYLVGLGGRGQRSLSAIGAWADVVEPYCSRVVGRKDWAPGAVEGIERIFTDRPYETRVIPRSRLVACLLRHAERAYPGVIQVRHGIEVREMVWKGKLSTEYERCVLKCNPCAMPDADRSSNDPEPPNANGENVPEACALVDEGGAFELDAAFVVGADGSRRTVANALVAQDRQRWVWPGRRLRVTRYKDTAVRVYKTIPLVFPPSWRKDINYSARTKTVNFDALPCLTGEYCGVLLIKPEDEVAQGLGDAAAARAYLDATLPQFSPYIPDAALPGIVAKPPSRLPQFRYVGPRLHLRSSTVLLGDAVHQVKPYFGLGVNAAFEDVAALDRCLDEAPSMGAALAAFSRQRAPEARVLTQISRSFDRGGVLALFTFILPLILDGIFHGALPRLFAPNTLAMLQRPELTFSAIRRRKRTDRALQLALIGTAGVLATRLALTLVRAASNLLAAGGAVRAPLVAVAALPMAAALSIAAWRFLGARVRGDVADVLAAQKKGLEGEQSEAE